LKKLLISKLSLFTAALWWGSLTTLGFFVVPMLFQYLPTKALAGNMAARLFEVQTWVSVGCGLVLLLILRPKRVENHINTENDAVGYVNMPIAGVFPAYTAIIFVAFGMLMALLVAFGVSPRIVARENLMLWHAVGSLMYLAQWVCAGVVLWRLSR
jgi:multisubunit Na+/H+ antiporter MnhB subunit